jgi:two-component system NtrC family response regulator
VLIRDGSRRVMLWNASRLTDGEGRPIGVSAIGQDVTRLKQIQALQAGENRVLALLAAGAPLQEVLAELVRTTEEVCPQIRCVLMQADAEEKTLLVAAAGGIPETYLRSLNGIVIGPGVACCGAAAHSRERCFAGDIATDAGWVAFRQPALLAGLRSCWSEPILSSEGRVLGTFDAYADRARRPSGFEVDSTERSARLAALAMENRARQEERLRETEDKFRSAVDELESLRSELQGRFSFEDIVAVSPAMLQVIRMAAQVAPTDATVLITGETGTGKEVLARAIHANSARRKGPFIAVNCGAIPETLMESELFGHERGAFTGADRRKPGQVERARGGTLFLDEIGELIPSAQVKLLRVLQERTYERLGGTETLEADIRVVAATNRNLAAEMDKGRFRDDLYYRLNVFHIHIPPLRERRQALPILARGILQRIASQLGRPEIGLSKPALQALQEYEWKGNVRELQNALERAAILCDGSLIGPEHLPIPTAHERAATHSAGEEEILVRLSAGFNLESLERELVRKAMRLARGNKSRAARLLGISRGSLRWRLANMEG